MQKELENKVLTIISEAEKFNIINNDIYIKSMSYLKEVIITYKKQVKETFTPMKEKAFQAHREVCHQENKLLEPAKKAETIIKKKASMWLKECEQKRRDEQIRLEREEKERQEAQAVKEAEHAESPEEAEEIIEEAIEEKPVVVAPQQHTKVQGISQRTKWKFRIDKKEKINPNFMIPDEKKIGQIVRAMGKNAETVVGGISVYPETSIAARG